MSGFENGFKPVQDSISDELKIIVRTTGQLAAEDIGFLGSSDPKAKRKLERQNRHLLELAQKLLANASAGSANSAPQLRKLDQIDENWRGVVDVIDNLLERADRSLDEFQGVIRRLGSDKEDAGEKAGSNAREGRSRRIHPLSKPQLTFKHVPRNDETTAFRPLLTSKPHAKVPLEESLRPVAGESGRDEYTHPYETEITESSFPPFVYTKSEPIPPNDDPAGVTLTWVETPEQVSAMLEDLKQAKEIAVDLEHHDQHSYVGLVCLMQISTREKDWIVDTLKPWRRDLQVLNEVFTDPKILKVFHGSTMDMIWLQRDLGLYVVGLFDTYHATVTLRYTRHGLAYLLSHFENFDAQKQYQMADWRTRPLTDEMMHYARADTHYLLHIYDNLRNELIENSQPGDDKLDYVLQESKNEALQRYERYFYDTEHGSAAAGWLALILRTPAQFNSVQFAVFRAVHRFRDRVARQTDESPLAVMRNDTIFALARTLPEDMPSLMSCINPVTQFVQPKITDLLNIVKKAKKEGENGPELNDILAQPEAMKAQKRLNKFRKLDKKAKAPGEETVTNTSVAAVLERTKEMPPMADVSRFWGSMLGGQTASGTAVSQSSLTDMYGLRLSLPIPASSADAEIPAAIPEPIETAILPPTVAPKAQEPSTFTIKDLRKSDLKRKAEDTDSDRPMKQQAQTISNDEDECEEQADFELLPDGDDEPRLARKAKKQSRLERQGTGATPSEKELSRYAELQKLDKATRRAQLEKRSADKEIWGKCKHYDKQTKKQNRTMTKQQQYLIDTATKLAEQGDGPAAAAATELLRLHRKGKEIPEALRNQVESSGFWGAEEPVAEEPAPFDYSKAPSLLAASKEIGERGKKWKDKKKREFDPYAKALDTPKGLPGRREGGAGRSKTFKS